eukprot:tig00021579_g22438.t1
MNGLADALERSKSLRHLDLHFLMHGASTEDYGEALRRLVAAAAPVLRSFRVAHSSRRSGGPDGEFLECLTAAGPLGAELAEAYASSPKSAPQWRRSASRALAGQPVAGRRDAA